MMPHKLAVLFNNFHIYIIPLETHGQYEVDSWRIKSKNVAGVMHRLRTFSIWMGIILNRLKKNRRTFLVSTIIR